MHGLRTGGRMDSLRSLSRSFGGPNGLAALFPSLRRSRSGPLHGSRLAGRRWTLLYGWTLLHGRTMNGGCGMYWRWCSLLRRHSPRRGLNSRTALGDRRGPVLNSGSRLRNGRHRARLDRWGDRAILNRRSHRPRRNTCRCGGAVLGHGNAWSGSRSGRNGQRTYWSCLHTGSRFRIRRCDGPRRHHRSRTAVIHSRKLRAVCGRLLSVLHLGRNSWKPSFVDHCQFGGRRTNLNTAASAVVADTVDHRIIDGLVVNVMNHRDVYVIHGAVIAKRAIVPVRAVISAARITKSVVDAAIKSDMRTPVSVMKKVASTIESPVGRGPKRADERRHHPSPWYPVIALRRVVPSSGRPNVVVTRAWRLLVFG